MRKFFFWYTLFISVAGAQPVHVSRTLTARDLVEVADMEGATISPDGDTIALVTHRPMVAGNTVDLAVWAVSIRGRFAPKRLATAGAPIWIPVQTEQPLTPRWSPDGRWIYFRALKHGDVQIWRVNLSGDQEQVTREAGDVLDFDFNPDGKLLFRTDAPRAAIIAAERKEDRVGVHMDGTVEIQMDVAHNDDYAGRRITLRRHGEFYHLGPAPSGDVKELTSKGKVIAASKADQSRYKTIIKAQRYGLFLPSKKLDIKTGPARSLAWVQRGKTPRVVNEFGAHGYKYHIVLQRGPKAHPEVCNEALCTAEKLRLLGWVKATGDVLFLRQDPDGSSGIYAWDPGSGVRAIYRSDGLLGIGIYLDRFNSAGCPITKTEAVCTIASAASPPKLIAINLATGTTRTLFDPNQSLRTKYFGKSRIVHWVDSNHIKESGILTLPVSYRKGHRIPLVVTSYRCAGFLQGGFGRDVPEHLLAQAGIATLCANFPGEYLTKKPGEADILPGLKQGFESWASEVHNLIGAGLVDACRVGASGTSYGSGTAAYAIWNSDLFDVASLSNPWELDPSTFYFFATPGNWFIASRSPIRTYYGQPDPEKDPGMEQWKTVSPALNVDNTHAAVLMQVADTEFRLGMEYFDRMNLANRPIDMFVFYHESHVKRQPVHRQVVYERNVNWFRFWFQDIEDGTSPLQNEYKYWRKLKEKAQADPIRQARLRAKANRGVCEPGWF